MHANEFCCENDLLAFSEPCDVKHQKTERKNKNSYKCVNRQGQPQTRKQTTAHNLTFSTQYKQYPSKDHEPPYYVWFERVRVRSYVYQYGTKHICDIERYSLHYLEIGLEPRIPHLGLRRPTEKTSAKTVRLTLIGQRA